MLNNFRLGAIDAKPRVAYLSAEAFGAALSEARVLDALIDQLEVPGKPAHFKAMSPDEKLAAIRRQAAHFQATPTSLWFEADVDEIIVASISRSQVLPLREISRIFSERKLESELALPVARWLEGMGLRAYKEVPMGANRADLVGFASGAIAEQLIAVELKNELKQLTRGLDQMATFCDYAHECYLACTPRLAVEYLERSADKSQPRKWDSMLLERKLEKIGAGLLIVEGEKVEEVRRPTKRVPEAGKYSAIKSWLQQPLR